MNYELSGFHPACTNKQLIVCGDALAIYCPACGIVANVEAIAAKISPADACKVGKTDRTIIGDQSQNVSKGEYKQ